MADALRLEALLIKKEVTYGVDPVPAVGDAVRNVGRIWPMLRTRHEFENRRDDVVSTTLVPPRRGTAKGRLVDIEVPWEAKGKGSAYALSTDIEADPLLQGSGLSVAVVTTGGAESLTYSFADSGHASYTAYAFAGGLRYIVRGCRGNWRWPISAGQQGLMRFVLTGMLIDDPTTVAVPSATYDAQFPPAAVGMGFTLNAGSPYVPVLQEAEFDLGNGVRVIHDGNATDGIQSIEIMERMPKLTCTIRKDAIATYNPTALFRTVTSHLVDLTLGGTQYNRFKLDVNEAYLSAEPEPVDYEGFAGYRLSFDCLQAVLIAD